MCLIGAHSQKTEPTPPPESLDTSYWAMLGSNQRPPPCRDGALPAELIAREALNVPGARGRGRLAAEMRVRAAAVIALFGIAPGSGDFGRRRTDRRPQPACVRQAGVRVAHDTFRDRLQVGADDRPDRLGPRPLPAHRERKEPRRGCQSSVSAVAPPSHAGATPSTSRSRPPGTWAAVRGDFPRPGLERPDRAVPRGQGMPGARAASADGGQV